MIERGRGVPLLLRHYYGPAWASLTRDRAPWIPPRRVTIPPGVMRQRDGRTAVTALVRDGRLDAAQLRGLAALEAEVRISPWRTITLVDQPDAAVADDLARLGFDPARPTSS